MANTLSGLIPTIYSAMNTVSREIVGFIPAVSRDATAAMAAVDQPVRSPVVPPMTAKNITAKNIADSGTDQAIGYVDLVINKQRFVDFNLTGEEELGLGASNATIAEQRFAQAFRTLTNEIETDLAALYVSASRAYGIAGTTPFGTGDDLTDITEVLRILDDNGAPRTDRHVVLGSAAVAKLLGKQPAMFRVNEAGGEMERRAGILRANFGADFHASGQVRTHLKGTGAGFLINNGAGEPVADTALTVDTGTGTILAGDIVTVAGDANKYVSAAALAANTVALAAPGLRIAAADNAALTVGNSYTANMAFSRDAIQLATRVPAVPKGGDQADDRAYVTDPVSGIVFEVSVYRQMRQVTYFVGACWGTKAVKPEHLALLLG